MLIKDVIGNRDDTVVSIPSTATLREAAALLKSTYISAVPVVDDNGNLVGLISERDIVHNINSKGVFYSARTVSEVMSKNIIDCEMGTTVETALRLMKMLHIRHIPVMAGKKIVGMVSIRDLAFARLEDNEDNEEEKNKILQGVKG